MITRVNDKPMKNKVNLESYSSEKGKHSQNLSTRFLHENRDGLKAFHLAVAILFKINGKRVTAILEKQAHADQGSETNVISRSLVSHLGLEVLSLNEIG